MFYNYENKPLPKRDRELCSEYIIKPGEAITLAALSERIEQLKQKLPPGVFNSVNISAYGNTDNDADVTIEYLKPI
jgi:hypothetical protein